ncbi:hypothetical protein ES703_24864 [subsurface metagenome]
MSTAEPKHQLQELSLENNSPQQTIPQVQKYQELKTKNIPELMLKLHNIYGDDNLSYVNRTFENLISCQQHQSFNFYKCEWCGYPIYHRIPCTSFFCDICRKKIANRLKQKLLNYVWNVPHRFCVFTLPPEIQEICSSWISSLYNIDDEANFERLRKYERKLDRECSRLSFYITGNTLYKYREEKLKKHYKYNFFKNNLATNLVYKSVNGAIQEYFDRRNLEVGFIMYPHTESTFDLTWFFHLNVLISTRGLRKSSKFTNFNKETNQRILPNHQAKYQTINTDFIDYDDIKQIYLKHLSRNFKVKIKKNKGNPIHFEGKLYPKQISKNLVGYCRKLLLKSEHIEKSNLSSITLRRWNTKNKRYESFNLSWNEFYNRCIQHIPPKFTRTIRIYGLYSHANKKRYFLTPVIKYIEKEIKCRECGSKGRLMFSVSRGQLVKIEEYYLYFNFKKILFMLDMKDFDIGDFLNLYALKDGYYVIKAKKDQARIGLACPIELYPVNFTNDDEFGIERYHAAKLECPNKWHIGEKPKWLN